MTKQIKKLLAEESIDSFGILPIEEVTVLRQNMLPQNAKSVIMLAVPYDDGTSYLDGVSAYAHVKDYHKFFEELFCRLIPKFEKVFPGKTFKGFADHSPIAEKVAAAKAGLGMIGKNSLLIHPIYGSYLFLGEIITDEILPYESFSISQCDSCMLCKTACPANAIGDHGIDAEKCLSALSQKKHLTEEELLLLQKNEIAWGCDICQKACPYNQKREYTGVPYFQTCRHGDFSAEEVEKMDEETFRSFAFSWRGRRRICENLYNIAKLANRGEKTDNFT